MRRHRYFICFNEAEEARMRRRRFASEASSRARLIERLTGPLSGQDELDVLGERFIVLRQATSGR
jgi:hypothetical protein